MDLDEDNDDNNNNNGMIVSVGTSMYQHEEYMVLVSLLCSMGLCKVNEYSTLFASSSFAALLCHQQ
jgi:hypothetical protein